MKNPSPNEVKGIGLFALPWGLLGTVVLVLGFECFVSRNSLDLTGSEPWDWARSGRSVSREGPANEILCFGSSVSSLGVMSRLIEQKTGKGTTNFAICSGPAPASYFLLRRALAAGAKPAAVLVDFHPGSLGAGLRPQMNLWPSLLTTRECLELSWAARKAAFFAEIALGVNLPSIRNRLAIRAGIAAALRGESSSQREMILAFQRNKRINKGTLLHQGVSYSGEIQEWFLRDLLPETWSPHPVSALYARRFVELAAARKIPVFWVIPPFAPKLQQERETKGLDVSYGRFARAMLDRYPNLMVVNASRSNYPVGAFLDAGHLKQSGAIAFSTDLAAVLRARLNGRGDGRRWVDLPSYRDQNSAVPMEDFAQTVVALRQGALKR